MPTASQVSQTVTTTEKTGLRYGWLLFVLGLIVVSLGIKFVSGTAGLVPTLFEPVLTLLAIGLMRVLPPRLADLPLLAGKTRDEILAQVQPLLGYAILFPVLLMPVVIWQSAQPIYLFPDRSTYWTLSLNYLIVGKIVLLFIPTVYFIWRYGGNAQQLGLTHIRPVWRWIAPTILTVLYSSVVLLDYFCVKVAQFPLWPVIAVTILIFFAAGFTEEFFYRVLLQTRLEAVTGSWNGIAITSLLFGLLHWPSRFAFVWLGHSGNPILDVVLALSAVLASQAVTGFFLGYMWTRYRNAWI